MCPLRSCRRAGDLSADDKPEFDFVIQQLDDRGTDDIGTGRAYGGLPGRRFLHAFCIEGRFRTDALVSGAFISGVLLATNGQMASSTAAATASYVLRALGVPIKKAAAITARPLPALEIDAEFAAQLL